MKESTPMRYHSAAPIVITNVKTWVIWRLMKGSTPMRNHSAAQTVTTNLKTWVIERLMKGSTPISNHLAAQSVTTNVHYWVIWRPMKESTLTKNHSASRSGIYLAASRLVKNEVYSFRDFACSKPPNFVFASKPTYVWCVASVHSLDRSKTQQ